MNKGLRQFHRFCRLDTNFFCEGITDLMNKGLRLLARERGKILSNEGITDLMNKGLRRRHISAPERKKTPEKESPT